MDDSRPKLALACLREAVTELEKPSPDMGRVGALLDDARTDLVDVIEEGTSSGASKADINQLEASCFFIRRAVFLLGERSPRTAAQFIKSASTHIQVVLSGNVIVLHPNTFDGGAA